MISFNNINTDIRTPGAYIEIDNSRALTGLLQNPHKVLILGQKASTGDAPIETLQAITRDNLADGFFGTGSILARMCNTFKNNNPNTEVYAMALSNDGGALAHGSMLISDMLTTDTVSNNHTWYLMINGLKMEIAITSGDSGEAIAEAVYNKILANSDVLPVSGAYTDGSVEIVARTSGTLGNYINIRNNYYDGETIPSCFSVDPMSDYYLSMTGGATDPDLGDAWAVIDGEQYHYIIQPYIDAGNLTEIEDELADRFLPLEDLQGHGFTAVRATQASCTVLGNGRNSPHNTIVGVNDAPQCPEEWAAAWGAVGAWNLNVDPARPLQFLSLKGILPPPIENRFTRTERDILLYDGIATYIVDNGGKVLLERSITTYQTNALGSPDPSYLDIQTLATLGEIRYQYKSRMVNRFIIPRFKLADDSFPVQPGQKIARPKDVRQESIALFTLLRDKGLIDNLDDFIDNLVVERNSTDRNRVDVLLPPTLIGQFRILAGQIQFIL